MVGDIVKVVVDRPLGSYHPKHKDMHYPINYGYIEERSCISTPLQSFFRRSKEVLCEVRGIVAGFALI